MSNPHIVKVPYINPNANSRYRPYLELQFSNPKSKIISTKTLALVDSGADHTIIPFALGVNLDLPAPSPDDSEIKYLSGVVGGTSYVERECEIYIIDSQKAREFKFNETVWWIHPNKEKIKQLYELRKQYKSLSDLKTLRPELSNTLDPSITSLELNYKRLLDNYQTDVLIGRPFFDNFDFIQFVHKDRNKEEKCFFVYKLSSKKSIEIIPLS